MEQWTQYVEFKVNDDRKTSLIAEMNTWGPLHREPLKNDTHLLYLHF